MCKSRRVFNSLASVELSLDLAPGREGSVLWHVLDVGAVVDQSALGLHVVVHGPVPLGETPLLGDVDLEADTHGIRCVLKQF